MLTERTEMTNEGGIGERAVAGAFVGTLLFRLTPASSTIEPQDVYNYSKMRVFDTYLHLYAIM